MTHPCPAVLLSAGRTGHTRKDADTQSESEKRDIETMFLPHHGTKQTFSIPETAHPAPNKARINTSKSLFQGL